MEEKIPLSVAIITKDEAENLAACLETVAFARQIIVVDSGSADDTCKIAAEKGCEVFREEWRGFGPQKQFAIDQCREPWVLVLDADERLSGETAQQIKRIVLNPSAGAAGYSFPRKNFFQGRWIRHAGWWPDRVVRLFRKGRGRMSTAMVHEAVMVDGPVEALPLPIEHFTESSLERVLVKIDRYSTAGAEEAFAAGKMSSLFSALLRAEFTFFQDYLLRRGFLDGAPGFTLAVLDGINKFFKYAKLNELHRRAKTDGSSRT